MQTTSQTLSSASILREVLTQLTRQKLPATPENFARIYKLVVPDLNSAGSVYETEFGMLEHLLTALNGLYADAPELKAKIRLLTAVIHSPLDADKRKKEIKHILEEILKDKESILTKLGMATQKMRDSLKRAFVEVDEISGHLGLFGGAVANYQAKLDGCVDMSDFRVLLGALSRELAETNFKLRDAKAKLKEIVQVENLPDSDSASNLQQKLLKIGEPGDLVSFELWSIRFEHKALEPENELKRELVDYIWLTAPRFPSVLVSEFGAGIFLVAEAQDSSLNLALRSFRATVQKYLDALNKTIFKGVTTDYAKLSLAPEIFLAGDANSLRQAQKKAYLLVEK